jgi:hypothetical protein
MKEMMKQVRTFLTFDRQLEINYISKLFAATHSQYQQIIPEWGHTSTRQKLIANYWFSDVLAHFAAMISLPLILSWMLISHFKFIYLLVLVIAVLFSFMVVLVASYWPSFSYSFLPKLEAVVSGYQAEKQQQLIRQLQYGLAAAQEHAKIEREQIIEQLQAQFVARERELNQQRLKQMAALHAQARTEQKRLIEQFQQRLAEQQADSDNAHQYAQIQLQEKLAQQATCFLKQQEAMQIRFQQEITCQNETIEQQQAATKKCRQAQLSNLALTLIYYVFAKAAGNITVESNDNTAALLLKLYGVDRGSLRANLELIAGSSSKRKNLGERKCTEIRNRFEEARSFLKEIGFQSSDTFLRDMEIRILGACA